MNEDEFWDRLNELSGDNRNNDDTQGDTVKQTDLDNDDIHRNRLESSALYRNPFITESEMDVIDEMNIRFIRTFT